MGLVNITITLTTVTNVIYYRRAMMNIAGFPHFPSVVSYLLVCFLACVSGSSTSPSTSFSSLCRDVSGSQFLSLSSLSSFTQSLLCHFVPPPSPYPAPHLHPLPSPSHPLSLSVSPSLTVCIASSLSVYFSLVA